MSYPNGMTERIKKAFDFAADSSKQLITLSTGIVALTITFAKDILGGLGTGLRWMVALSWLGYLLSMLFGSWTLLALTGTLEPQTAEDRNKEATIRGSNVTIPTLGQIGSFLLSTLLIIIVAIVGSCHGPAQQDATSVLPTVAAIEYGVGSVSQGAPRSDALLTLDAAGQYRWKTSRGQVSGTYTFDATKTQLRFTGPLSRWGEGTLAADKSLTFRLPRERVVLVARRWMCPLHPFC